MLVLMSTRLVVMETGVGFDVHVVSNLGQIPWLPHTLVENHHSRRIIEEDII